LDCWQPGEHNGTFRGNNLAFVTAKAALDVYWRSDDLSTEVQRKGRLVRMKLGEMADHAPGNQLSVRGRGMVQGLDCGSGDLASDITRRAFEKGLVIETSGSEGQVVKCLSPLTISDQRLMEGLRILEESVKASFDNPVPDQAKLTGALR